MGQCSGKVSTKKFVCGDLIEVTGLRYATLRLTDVTVTINGEHQLPQAAEQRLQIREILKEHSEGSQFSKKIFSVLPDVATLAEVYFGIGCEMERYHFCSEKHIGANRDFLTGDEVRDSSKTYSFDLVGYKQVRELSLTLDIRPRVGPLAGKNISFWWRNDTLEVKGGGPNYSFSFARHHWYHSFSNVTEFCKICLHIAHHVPRTAAIGLHDFLVLNDEQEASEERFIQEQPWTLSQLAGRSLMCHLDAIPPGLAIPTRYLSKIYSGCDPVDVTLHLWPSTFHNGKSCRITVLDGLLYCELTHMIMLRYNVGPSYQLKWYENFKPVSGMQQIGIHSKRVDCFIVNKFVDSELEDVFYGEEQQSVQTNVPIIISLVGFEVKDLYVNPSMTVKEFDKEVRKLFGLKSDSFLVLLPEGDLSPQYSRNDQWKCVYPLLLGSQTQHRSSSSGSDNTTRRSSHRNGSSNYAPRNPSSTTGSPQHQSTSSFRSWQPFQRSNSVRQPSSTSNSPYGLSSFQRSTSIRPSTKPAPSPMVLATKLLSNNHRNFPMHKNIHSLSIDEVYDMPMYSYDLERYGIFSHSVVQVFEVTGPTVPIAFCGSTAQQRSADHASTPSHVKSRSINLMDINPTWPIPTLTQYVEAIICPRQAVSQKKITLGNNTLIDSVDVMKLKVSEILDVWKPVWWKSKGSSSAHHKMSSKDITPEDVLVIEAMNHQYN